MPNLTEHSSRGELELEEEVDAAIALIQLRLLNGCPLSEARAFSHTLRFCILDRIQGHCYSDIHVGRAYRCLRSNRGSHDKLLITAAKLSNTRNLLELMPVNYCIWIDPGCVAMRINDDAKILERSVINTRFPVADPDTSSVVSSDDDLRDEMLTYPQSSTTDDMTTIATPTSTTPTRTTSVVNSPSPLSPPSSSLSPTVSQESLLPNNKQPIDTEAATRAARAAATAALAEAMRNKQQMAKQQPRHGPPPKPRGSRRRRRRQVAAEPTYFMTPAGYAMAPMHWHGHGHMMHPDAVMMPVMPNYLHSR
eukprot:TRINITY_DN4461_c0_g1_i1.p1 TRINITY_DN4461_c0_g1~~TRINITY_DN4461_c0_g1_i1.p1  ORF type:complete len:308 (+),score=71.59 TRINITY_DN4461_c0_g1_i1:382-1305(+)